MRSAPLPPPAVPQPARTARSDGLATRDRILGAARACMTRHGWERTSLREVAEEAGVAKGLVLYHFGSKEDLFVAMQASVYASLAGRIAAAVDRVGPSPRTALWALEQLVETVLAEREALPLIVELWARALRDESAKPAARSMREWMRELAQSTLERVLGEDAKRLVISTDALADLIIMVVTGLQLGVELDPDPARLRRSIDELQRHAGALLAMHPMAPPEPRAARPQRAVASKTERAAASKTERAAASKNRKSAPSKRKP